MDAAGGGHSCQMLSSTVEGDAEASAKLGDRRFVFTTERMGK